VSIQDGGIKFVPVGKIVLTTNNLREIRGSDDCTWQHKHPKPQYNLGINKRANSKTEKFPVNFQEQEKPTLAK